MNDNVWVIDDDRSIRWVLDRALSQAGIPITAFNTADQAMHHLHDDPPLAIITDVRMPGINGFELMKQIKNISPHTPIIIMTAYTDLDTTVQTFEEGAFEYLPKPFDIDDALELVARACSLNGEDADSKGQAPTESGDWQRPLRQWAQQQLSRGETDILKNAAKTFEKTLLDCALEATRGRKQDAARLLGWGRNTLTRKLKELS